MTTCMWCSSPFVLGPGSYTSPALSLCPTCVGAGVGGFQSNFGGVAGEYKEKEVTVAYEAKDGFKFGCDPELFVKNEKGVYVTAAGLIPGTKEEPYKVKYGAVQVDGMAAEFNIDPAENFADFNRNIQAVLGQLQSMLPPGHTLDAVPAVHFTPEEWEKAPPEAKELGCSPDYNAWTGGVNSPPNDPTDPYLRTASGHIHLGWIEDAELSDPQHLMNCRDIVKQLDWYLGGWSLRMDNDTERRRLYGKAGACRYKTYGVEYRVLSNFWISTRERRLAVWNRLQMAITDMRKANLAEKAPAGHVEALIGSINGSVRDPAMEGLYRYPLASLDRSYARY